MGNRCFTGVIYVSELLIEFILWNEIGLFNFVKELRKRSSIDSEIVSATFDLLDILLFDFNICVPYYDSVFVSPYSTITRTQHFY